MSTPAAPALEFREVAFGYPDGRQVLFGIDVTVQRGERVAVLGPNGAGKTTLALHCNGILTPGLGSVLVGGVPATRDQLAEIRRRVGIVFQDPDDQLFMPTVRDDVAFGPVNFGVRGEALDAVVSEALSAVGMDGFEDRAAHHLSFGQRRRVAVATVLACQPTILVLDEPTANLDPASRRELADVLAALDVTIVTCTHDLPFALEHYPRSVIMNEGRIVADGATHDLLSDDALMTANRLELPFAFDPRSATPTY